MVTYSIYQQCPALIMVYIYQQCPTGVQIYSYTYLPAASHSFYIFTGGVLPELQVYHIFSRWL